MVIGPDPFTFEGLAMTVAIIVVLGSVFWGIGKALIM